MKEKIVLLTFFFLGAVACHDHSIENAFWEKEAGGSPIEEFLKIDDTRYGEFCADERFVEICSSYYDVSHSTDSNVSVFLERNASVQELMEAYEKENQCDNLLSYVIKYVNENCRSTLSRSGHTWGICELYDPALGMSCNVKSNWNLAWNTYYSMLIACVGKNDSPEQKAFIYATMEGLSDVYFGLYPLCYYYYDRLFPAVIDDGIKGMKYTTFSVEKIQNYMIQYALLPIENTCTYVYHLKGALYDAANLAIRIYQAYVPSMPQDSLDRPILEGEIDNENGDFEGEIRMESHRDDHYRIIEKVIDKLNLSEVWLEHLVEGCTRVDEVLDIDSFYKHAIKKEEQLEDETIELVKEFFINKAYLAIIQPDLYSLGEALHPIMDTYIPARSIKIWENGVWNYFPFLFEKSLFPGDRLEVAVLVVEKILVVVTNMNPNLGENVIKENLSKLFDDWLYGDYGPRGPYSFPV